MTHAIVNNFEDTLDSRDINKRYTILQSRFQNGTLHPDEVAEHNVLSTLVSQGEDATERWDLGVKLVRSTHFKRYAKELAASMHINDESLAWPYTAIDWNVAAQQYILQCRHIQFDGIIYFIVPPL